MMSMFNMQNLRASLKKYGRTGVLVYLGISGCVTASGCNAASPPPPPELI
jgi:hypothetical protein